MRSLLVLRPEPGASATAERAQAQGWTPIVAPLFTIEPVSWQVPSTDGLDGLLLTSANAVRQAGPALAAVAHLPAHAVGEETARAGRAAGLAVVAVGSGGVDALLAQGVARRLLHLCGEDRRPPREEAATVVERVVYRSVAAARLPAALRSADRQDVVALLHSPRSARLFSRLVDGAGLDRSGIAIVAISRAALLAAGDGWRCSAAASRPDDAAMLAAAAALCQDRAG